MLVKTDRTASRASLQHDYAVLKAALAVATRHLKAAKQKESAAIGAVLKLERMGWTGVKRTDEQRQEELVEARRILREAEVAHYDLFKAERAARTACALFRKAHHKKLGFHRFEIADEATVTEVAIDRRFFRKDCCDRKSKCRCRRRCRPDHRENNRDAEIRSGRHMRTFAVTADVSHRFLERTDVSWPIVNLADVTDPFADPSLIDDAVETVEAA